MTSVTVRLPLNKLVVVTENHGGYMGGECISCGASGWLNGKYGLKAGTKDAKEWKGTHLVHKPSCPVNKFAAEARDR